MTCLSHTENPRQAASPGAGNFLTAVQHGEPEQHPSPTWRNNSASVAMGQVRSPRADGGEKCAHMT